MEFFEVVTTRRSVRTFPLHRSMLTTCDRFWKLRICRRQPETCKLMKSTL